MNEIQQQIGRGEYRVDDRAVADAIIRRLIAGQARTGLARSPERDN